MVDELQKTECYENYKRLIFQRSYQEHHKTGRPLNDLIGEANLAFAQAWNTFTPEKQASFTTWLWWTIHYQFMAGRRANRKADKSRTVADETPLVFQEARREFHLEQWLEELSQDGRTVAKLALEPPPDIQIFGSAVRTGLRTFLKDYLGWERRRIEKSFEEIAEAITC